VKLEEYVKLAQNGDKEALLKLIMDKKSELYRLAYVYTENQEDSMDAMEDMIVILYQQIGKLKKPEAFYSWSKTILVNCCKSIIRKRKKIVSLDEVEHLLTDISLDNKESVMDVLVHLKTLSQEQQEAIKLKYLIGMDYKSIAMATKVPVGTVKSRVFNGLKKLKKSLGGEYL